jgi:hypothetical protein
MIDVVTVSSTNFGPASTNYFPMKIFKPFTLVSLGIAIAAALLTQPMRATAIQTLVITENSSTSLTALLNGTTSLTVTPSFTDEWLINLTGVSGPSTTTNQQNWFEPGGAAAGFVNQVLFDPQHSPNQLLVRSDFGPGFINGLADGATDTSDFTLNGSALSVTFIDKGDVASAPDSGSTLGLLSLALAGLFGASRLRSLRLA